MIEDLGGHMVEPGRGNVISVPLRDGERSRRALADSGELSPGVVPRSSGDRLLLGVLDIDVACDVLSLAGVEDVVSVHDETLSTRTVPPGSYKELLKDLSPEEQELLPTSYDRLGSVIILKVPDGLTHLRDRIGEALMSFHKGVTGVFHDEGVKEELRLRDLIPMAGDTSTEVVHRENDLRFHLDARRVFFSPRLAYERGRVMEAIRESGNERGTSLRILDLFAGCGPYSLLIHRDVPEAIITAVDLNPVAVESFMENLQVNRLPVEGVDTHVADAREFLAGLDDGREFDVAIMNLPGSAMSFLGDVLPRMASGGVIFVYHVAERDGAMGELMSLLAPHSELVSLPPAEVITVKNYSATRDVLAVRLEMLR